MRPTVLSWKELKDNEMREIMVHFSGWSMEILKTLQFYKIKGEWRAQRNMGMPSRGW